MKIYCVSIIYQVLPVPGNFAIVHANFDEDTPSKRKLLKRKVSEISNKTNEIPEYAKWKKNNIKVGESSDRE